MRILHLSDLHFVDGEGRGRIESGNRGPVGNEVLAANFERLRGEFNSADVVVVSGDTTDSGTYEQWQAFLQTVHGFPGLAHKIVLAPGNHDINQVESSRVDTPAFDGRGLRAAHFLRARDELVRDVPSLPIKSRPPTNIDDVFPAVRTEFSTIGLHVAFITINTVAPSTNVLGNAVGRFLAGQIPPLVTELQRQGHIVVIVGHHHPLPYFDSAAPPRTILKRLWSIGQGAAMESVDGTRFLEQLEATIFNPVLYLHGHKHIYRLHVSRTTGLRICGAPSMLFGDEGTGSESCIAVRHEITNQEGSLVFNTAPISAKQGVCK